MKHFLPLLLLCLLIASCSRVKYEQTNIIENNIWQRFEPEVFDFNIKNVDDCYDIVMSVKVDTTLYTQRDLPLVVNFSNEIGEHRMFYSSIQLRNKDGVYEGEHEGRYVMVQGIMKEYFYFNNPSLYHLEIKQGTSKYEIAGIASFGIQIKKSNLKLK